MSNKKSQKGSKSVEAEKSWRKHLSLWRKSGLSMVKYCKGNRLKYSSFLYWRRQFESTSNQEENGFVEMPVRVNVERREISKNDIRIITPNRWHILIGNDTKLETLRSVIAIVRQESC